MLVTVGNRQVARSWGRCCAAPARAATGRRGASHRDGNAIVVDGVRQLQRANELIERRNSELRTTGVGADAVHGADP